MTYANPISKWSKAALFGLFAATTLQINAPATLADDLKHGVISADKLAWGLFDPKQPDGLHIAVLYGDPSKPGPFAVRLKIPGGMELGNHSHTNAEFVTVISGKAMVSWGTKSDITAGDTLMPGSFFWMSGKDHHDFKTIDETVVELHSVGPFDMIADK